MSDYDPFSHQVQPAESAGQKQAEQNTAPDQHPSQTTEESAKQHEVRSDQTAAPVFQNEIQRRLYEMKKAKEEKEKQKSMSESQTAPTNAVME